MQNSPLWQRLDRACGRRMAVWFAQRSHRLSLSRSLVSFTFDDFPHSSLSTAGSILEQAGLAGTFYASIGLMGKWGATGKIFHREDIAQLIAKGHELGCHTYDHCSAWETATSKYLASIRRNSDALSALVTNATFSTHSYPISFPPPRTKRALSQYFRACRGGGQSFNEGKIDLNYLNAFFIEKSIGNPHAIKNVIRLNAQMQGWLIFATHDVSDDHTCYGCSSSLFQDVVRWVLESDAQILPISAALDLIGAPDL